MKQRWRKFKQEWGNYWDISDVDFTKGDIALIVIFVVVVFLLGYWAG